MFMCLAASPSPYPPLLPSDPKPPASSSPGLDHWGWTPPLDHGSAAAKPTIGARQRQICLSSCSPLPAPCAAKTSHPAVHTENTLSFNHTSRFPLHCYTLLLHWDRFGYRVGVLGPDWIPGWYIGT